MRETRKFTANSLIRRTYLIKRLLIDLLYPNRCPICDKNIPFDEYSCTSCSTKFSNPPRAEKIAHIDGFASFTAYDELSIAFIDRIKNKADGYALSYAAFKIYEAVLRTDFFDKIDVVTYIPMIKDDLFKRGYNQSKIIAEETAGLLGVSCMSLLKKLKKTPEQKTLSEKERRKNLEGAFDIRSPRELNGVNVLLIDDIATTGSTLSQASKILKAKGADKVFAASFAKTEKKIIPQR